MVFYKAFWKAALIRAVRTVCQAALAMIPAAATIIAVDWLTVLSTSALAGVVSLLTSIATGLPEAIEKENDVRIVYLDDEGREISQNDILTEQDGTITIKAYDRYDEDGSPIVEEEGDSGADR